jgi:hypothetical protein
MALCGKETSQQAWDQTTNSLFAGPNLGQSQKMSSDTWECSLSVFFGVLGFTPPLWAHTCVNDVNTCFFSRGHLVTPESGWALPCRGTLYTLFYISGGLKHAPVRPVVRDLILAVCFLCLSHCVFADLTLNFFPMISHNHESIATSDHINSSKSSRWPWGTLKINLKNQSLKFHLA